MLENVRLKKLIHELENEDQDVAQTLVKKERFEEPPKDGIYLVRDETGTKIDIPARDSRLRDPYLKEAQEKNKPQPHTIYELDHQNDPDVKETKLRHVYDQRDRKEKEIDNEEGKGSLIGEDYGSKIIDRAH